MINLKLREFRIPRKQLADPALNIPAEILGYEDSLKNKFVMTADELCSDNKQNTIILA